MCVLAAVEQHIEGLGAIVSAGDFTPRLAFIHGKLQQTCVACVILNRKNAHHLPFGHRLKISLNIASPIRHVAVTRRTPEQVATSTKGGFQEFHDSRSEADTAY